MEYPRFRIYEASYIVSVSSVLAIAVVYLVLWKKEAVWRKIGGVIRRFRLGHSR